MTQSNSAVCDLSDRLFREFLNYAKAEDVSICPVWVARQTLSLSRDVYQETYDYRSFQISLAEVVGDLDGIGNIDFHFDEIGRGKEIQLLSITLQKVPGDLIEFWNLRKAWMRASSSEADVKPLLETIQNSRIF